MEKKKETQDEKMYCITLKESQMMRLARAADIVSRVRCGQFWDIQQIMEAAYDRHHDTKIGDDDWYDMRHEVESALARLKKLCWDVDSGANHGIHYDEEADSLFDMRKSMEMAYWENMPPERKEALRMSVMSDGPLGIDKDGEITVKRV